ncbi:MAG: SEC-C metal-binding domain-containing protein [Solirubrobacteraceae bacterium]
MPGPGRNDPCPCGSGRKTKRCCGERRGPGEDDLARAFLASHARDAASRLRHLGDDELADLFDELVELPELDLRLTLTLPEIRSPEIQRLLAAVANDDLDAGDELIPRITQRLDTPTERARIAGVVLDLRDARRLDPLIAAAAIIDLRSRSQTLIRACLIQAVFIQAGVIPTPSGLRIAA